MSGLSGIIDSNIYRSRGVSFEPKNAADGLKADSKQPGINKQETDPEKQMVEVPQPPHGSGCGHCNMQVGKMVKKEDLGKAIQEAEDAQYNEVMEHEMAHNRALGPMADGPPKVFNKGKGGGEQGAKMPVMNESNPEKTITEADYVIKGALAPKDPSSQDRSIAAKAQSIKSKAESKKGERATNGGKPQQSQAIAQPQFKVPQFSMQA